jgi:hypothetical protein
MNRLLGVVSLALVSCGAVVAQQERGDKEVAFQGTVTVPFQNVGDGATGFLVPRFGYYLNARNFIGLENDDILAKGYQASGVSLLYRFYMGKKGSRLQPYVGLAPGLLAQRQPVGVQIVVSQASATASSNQIANATNLTAAQKTQDQNILTEAIQRYQSGLFCVNSTALNTGQCSTVHSGTRNVTAGDFQGAGEVGIKFYLNRKFAFEASYRLNYVHQSASFAQDVYTVTNSTLTPTNYAVSFSGPSHSDGQKGGGLGFKQSANNFLLFGFSYVF